jgi:DNA replication protein DnaC
VILELLKAKAAERRLRSIRYRRGQARFLMIKDLDSFRLVDCPVDEAQIRSLYEGGFLEAHSNLIFGGGTGTGKTHLAIGIAANLVRRGSRARFYNPVDLANDLEQEETLAGRGGRPSASLSRFNLVMHDERGYRRSPKTPANCGSTSSPSSTSRPR